MEHEDAVRIASELTLSHGLGLRGDFILKKSGTLIILSPADAAPSESFSIHILVGWKRLKLEFIPGNLSLPLIRSLGKTSNDSKAVFKNLVNNLRERGATLQMTVNGLSISPDIPEIWPDQWNKFSFFVQTPYIGTDIDLSKDVQGAAEALKWAGLYLNLLICLLPLEEEEPLGLIIPDGQPEGRLTHTEINHYERSRVNRLACITLRGTVCLACGFNFGDVYGAVGDGLIIIHHVIPVSQLGDDYVLNPATDLVPVCANCHVIMHRKDPPYAVDDIRVMLKK